MPYLPETPEEEVHRKLVQDLIQKRSRLAPDAPFYLHADDSELRKRWSTLADGEDRLRHRIITWKETLQALPIEWV